MHSTTRFEQITGFMTRGKRLATTLASILEAGLPSRTKNNSSSLTVSVSTTAATSTITSSQVNNVSAMTWVCECTTLTITRQGRLGGTSKAPKTYL